MKKWVLSIMSEDNTGVKFDLNYDNKDEIFLDEFLSFLDKIGVKLDD